MDLVRLGPAYSTTYTPDAMIEGYSSCIWTERFYSEGDFEIKTPLIEETLALLPAHTLISHLDTDEVMVVETHVINLDDDVPELTITGRSLISILNDRYVDGPYQKKRKMRRYYTATGAAAVLIYNSVDNTSGKDVTRGDNNADTAEKNDYSWNTKDAIPNVCVTDSVGDDGTTKRWWVQQGPLLPQLQQFLVKRDIGLRTIRPGAGSNAEVCTVTALPLDDRGKVVRTYTTGITSLRFDIYKGIDRTTSQSVNPQVNLSVLQSDIDKVQYLWSKAAYSTAAKLMSSVSIGEVYRNTTEQEYSGLQRRVMAIDAGEPELPDEPEKPTELKSNATSAQKAAYAAAMDTYLDKYAVWKTKRDAIVAEFKDDAKEDALSDLKKAGKTTMLSGDISPYAHYQYRTHYNLGDKITLTGDYGLSEDMIVAEYIRTEDETGDRGVPGLMLPDPD